MNKRVFLKKLFGAGAAVVIGPKIAEAIIVSTPEPTPLHLSGSTTMFEYKQDTRKRSHKDLVKGDLIRMKNKKGEWKQWYVEQAVDRVFTAREIYTYEFSGVLHMDGANFIKIAHARGEI